MECKLLEMKSFGNGGASANIAICEVLKFHVAEDIFTNGIIDPTKIDLVARMSGSFYSRAASGIFNIEQPMVKKCIGYDQVPKQIRESEIYSANDLGKFGNSESIPTDDEVKVFIQNLTEEKLEQFESSLEAFQRYHRLNDHKKMLKSCFDQ